MRDFGKVFWFILCSGTLFSNYLTRVNMPLIAHEHHRKPQMEWSKIVQNITNSRKTEEVMKLKHTVTTPLPLTTWNEIRKKMKNLEIILIFSEQGIPLFYKCKKSFSLSRFISFFLEINSKLYPHLHQAHSCS